MEMTTPVFTRSGTSDEPAPSSSGRVTPILGDASMNRMQFMLEKRFKGELWGGSWMQQWLTCSGWQAGWQEICTKLCHSWRSWCWHVRKTC